MGNLPAKIPVWAGIGSVGIGPDY